MNCSTLAAFRDGLYLCFNRAGDALMNAADALLTDTTARSFVELSLSPVFERQWPSLYEAFEDALVPRAALVRLFAAFAPSPAPGERLVLGGDASSVLRPHSRTGRDRTYVHQSNLPEGTKPVTPGWQFSTLSVLPPTPSSWTYGLDTRRIPSQKTQGEVMADQLHAVVPQLPQRPLFEGDGYYGSAAFLRLTEPIACDKLLRLARNRVLYRCAPPKTGIRGAPRKDGAPFQGCQPATQGVADARFEGTDTSGQPIEVSVWHNLHFKQARHLPVSVIRVIRHGARATKRDPRVSWFVFHGQHFPALSQIPVLYARRYSLEHAYRVDKQDLLWTAPRLRTPEQMQCWTDLVVGVRNQLFLAHQQEGLRQPWESKSRAVTPQQVRRAMGAIVRQLGTPARPCQPRGKSAGRAKGTKVNTAVKYKVVFKNTKKPRQIV